MTAAPATSPESADLLRVNRELAELLHTPPLPLAFGADAADQDSLIICGLLGGKDVGKSTLINALADIRVSKDESEVGRGTEHPVAYVHASVSDELKQRLHVLDAHLSIEIVVHHADALRHAALVDLPDFDSEFLEHLHTVQAVAPLLDRVLWVLTPRKVGDRAWVSVARDVIKDASNVRFVLNKIDELMSDADALDGASAPPEQGRDAAGDFWQRQRDWFIESSSLVEAEAGVEDFFLVAAAYPRRDRFESRIADLWDDRGWERYAVERNAVRAIGQLVEKEVSRLQQFVLQPVDEDRGRAIKLANRRRELLVGADRLRAHYRLNEILAPLTHAVDPSYWEDLLDEAFPADFRLALATAIQSALKSDRRLADEWLERRVEQWPLLRVVYWPFGWIARVAGHAFRASDGVTPRPRSEPQTDVDSVLDGPGVAPAHRLDTLRARLLADHAVVMERIALERALPSSETLAGRLRREAAALPTRLHALALQELQEGERKPSLLGRSALWGVLLWFPFLQPLTAGALEIVGEGGAFHTTRGLYRMVTALSAAHLLTGFAVVGVVFLALLAAMYARRLRGVRLWRARHELNRIHETIEQLLCDATVEPFVQPIRAKLDRLEELGDRLSGKTSDAAC